MKFVKATTLYDGIGSKNNVYVGFEGDRISYVSNAKPDGDIIAEGVVTPAFIDPHSHIGMDRYGEPSRESEANEQMDPMLPLGRAIDGVYMDDMAFTESVENNVLYSVVLPGSGNIMGGMGALLRNFGKNIKEAYVRDIGVKMALGYNPRSTVEWKGGRPSTRMGVSAIIRDRFTKARKTMKLIESGKKTIDEIDPDMEFLISLLKGEKRIMCHVHKQDDAFFLMSLVDEFNIKPIVNHGMDFYSPEILMDLKERNIPLVYGPMDSLPYKVELKHESWRNVKMIRDSGVKFALISDHPVILQRNLFLTTRHFMRFGASREECISYITSRSAEILGLTDLGTIENGKLASFSVWEGDPFSFQGHPKLVIWEGKTLYSE
ncbi:amidohydrolase family protein [Cuniculiplasma sp. SKW3]|uniref:amidohydrolase family protein n=1 Tax=Cuniculiplasma sp. SKW3 TaxID=3400170 RepID=UPI003FD02C60